MKSQQEQNEQPPHSTGAKPVSGLNKSMSVEQAKGQFTISHQLEDAHEAMREAAHTPAVKPAQSSELLGSITDSLRTGWQRVSDGVRNVNISPTTLAIGAAGVAAVGAAVWLSRRKWVEEPSERAWDSNAAARTSRREMSTSARADRTDRADRPGRRTPPAL